MIRPILPGSGRSKAVETFAPTAGRVLGVITLAIGALILVNIVVEWRTWQGLSAAAVVVAVGTFIWLGLVRPSAVAFEDALVLRNMLRDTRIPWHLVESASVAPVLTVIAGGQPYRSSAIAVTGADRRSMRRSRRNAAAAARSGQPANPGNAPLADRAPSEYTVHRIDTLSRKYADASKGSTEVERHWRWPEFAVIAAAILVAVVTSRLG